MYGYQNYGFCRDSVDVDFERYEAEEKMARKQLIDDEYYSGRYYNDLMEELEYIIDEVSNGVRKKAYIMSEFKKWRYNLKDDFIIALEAYDTSEFSCYSELCKIDTFEDLKAYENKLINLFKANYKAFLKYNN